MLLDVVIAILLVTDSLLGILSAESLDKGLSFSRDLVRELDRVDSPENAFVDGEIVLSSEGRTLGQQLVNKNTKGPEISAEIMTSVGNNFWGNVLGRSAESPGLVARKDFFSESKIDESNVALSIDHKIFWFKISVAEVAIVEVLKGGDDTSGVESTNGVVEGASLMKKTPKITTEVSIGEDVDVL